MICICLQHNINLSNLFLLNYFDLIVFLKYAMLIIISIKQNIIFLFSNVKFKKACN